jgi:cell division septal protein FtsQ
MRRTYAGAGNSNRGRAIRLDTYEDGNAVRRLDEETEEVERPRKKRQVSRRTRENRERAMNVGIGYILFLTAVCIASVYFCIHYLQLRSELINQNETIAAMQNDLSKLTTDNDALYKSALASVSMDDVRQTALTTLNLHYATESQIRYYDANDESYVRQFTDIDGNN